MQLEHWAYSVKKVKENEFWDIPVVTVQRRNVLPPYSVCSLKKEAEFSSETPVPTYRTIQITIWQQNTWKFTSALNDRKIKYDSCLSETLWRSIETVEVHLHVLQPAALVGGEESGSFTLSMLTGKNGRKRSPVTLRCLTPAPSPAVWHRSLSSCRSVPFIGDVEQQALGQASLFGAL
jgi:hypothetical protein